MLAVHGALFRPEEQKRTRTGGFSRQYLDGRVHISRDLEPEVWSETWWAHHSAQEKRLLKSDRDLISSSSLLQYIDSLHFLQSNWYCSGISLPSLKQWLQSKCGHFPLFRRPWRRVSVWGHWMPMLLPYVMINMAWHWLSPYYVTRLSPPAS